MKGLNKRGKIVNNNNSNSNNNNYFIIHIYFHSDRCAVKIAMHVLGISSRSFHP